MTDFTTTWAHHTASFTYGVAREVVVQHEGIFTLTFQGIDNLLITGSTQRSGNDGLGFTTGKQRRTVGLRQGTNLNIDTTYGLVITAVDTRLTSYHTGTHSVLFQLGNHS